MTHGGWAVAGHQGLQAPISGSAKDLGEIMAHPGPHAEFPNLNRRQFFGKERCESGNFTLFGSKFAQFQPAAPARSGQSQPSVVGLRVTGWLTETLVCVCVDTYVCGPTTSSSAAHPSTQRSQPEASQKPDPHSLAAARAVVQFVKPLAHRVGERDPALHAKWNITRVANVGVCHRNRNLGFRFWISEISVLSSQFSFSSKKSFP
jgi:hypothetical protein